MCTIWTICMMPMICVCLNMFVCILFLSGNLCYRERSTGGDPQLGTAISGDFCEFQGGLHGDAFPLIGSS